MGPCAFSRRPRTRGKLCVCQHGGQPLSFENTRCESRRHYFGSVSDHVVLAIGRDYPDEALIDGVIVASGGQRQEVSVQVLPVG